MQRRAPGEKCEKLRSRTLDALARPSRQKLARWALDEGAAFSRAVEAPAELDDRAADSWEPLLSVADAAGGRWPDLGRALAVRLSTERGEDEAEAPGVAVLSDLKTLLESGDLAADEEGVSGEEACRWLRSLPDRPWAKWGRSGDGLTPASLARLLKPFGLKSSLVGPERTRVRRYPVAALRDAFSRFVSAPAEHVPTTRTPAQPTEVLRIGSLESATCAAERLSGSVGTERLRIDPACAQAPGRVLTNVDIAEEAIL